MMWKDMIMDFATSLEDMEHKIRKKVLFYQLSITSTIVALLYTAADGTTEIAELDNTVS